MRLSWSAVLLVLALTLCVSSQEKTTSVTSLFHNDRLKALRLKDSPITGDTNMRLVTGFWESDSDDPSKTLLFPQQVKITCTHFDKSCKELSVSLAPVVGMVSIQEINEEEYAVDSWDGHGLVASYGGAEVYSPCQRHVLTMDFDSGAVSVVDIPTHKKGCEALKETDSYRLIQGNYYVDTSPGNDMDRPEKKK